MSDKILRLMQVPAFWIISSLLLAGVISNLASGQADGPDQSSTKPIDPQSDTAKDDAATKLLREGTRLEKEAVICRNAGERLIVEMESGKTLVVLENLTAQRVLAAVRDDASDAEWIIQGVVTEFHSTNYVFLERVNRLAKK